MYRTRLKKRTRKRSETLSQLAQDVDALVRRSYPAAPEEMIVVLARDSFTDALDDQQLQIYVKQAHPGDLQVALARALEFEASLKTTSGQGAAANHAVTSEARRRRWRRSHRRGRQAETVFVADVGAVARKATDAVGAQGNEERVLSTGWVLMPFSLATRTAASLETAPVSAPS